MFGDTEVEVVWNFLHGEPRLRAEPYEIVFSWANRLFVGQVVHVAHGQEPVEVRLTDPLVGHTWSHIMPGRRTVIAHVRVLGEASRRALIGEHVGWQVGHA